MSVWEKLISVATAREDELLHPGILSLSYRILREPGQELDRVPRLYGGQAIYPLVRGPPIPMDMMRSSRLKVYAPLKDEKPPSTGTTLPVTIEECL